MIGILITGHGNFASGIASAIEVILGKQENFVTVDFPDGDTKTELEQKIQDGFSKLSNCEHLVVFCDLLSGSPFNTVVPYAMKNDNIRVFFGTNLAMLMEFTMNRNMGSSFGELIPEVVACGKSQVGIFTVKNIEEEDEDF
jgi:PTS system N-acetylgalactosamine-specific IIA component